MNKEKTMTRTFLNGQIDMQKLPDGKLRVGRQMGVIKRGVRLDKYTVVQYNTLGEVMAIDFEEDKELAELFNRHTV
jgi:hypothetical protein